MRIQACASGCYTATLAGPLFSPLVVAGLSWPDRGHHVPALTVTSGGRGVGFDVACSGTPGGSRTLLCRQPNSNFLINSNSHFIVSSLVSAPLGGWRSEGDRALRVDGYLVCIAQLYLVVLDVFGPLPRLSYSCASLCSCRSPCRSSWRFCDVGLLSKPAHLGQPQLSDKARSSLGHSEDCGILSSTVVSCVLVSWCFAGTGLVHRIPGHSTH